MKKLFLCLFLFLANFAFAQVAHNVNVFLGSSGDHGQMSPAASYPFGMLSIGPQTYPKLHMGYENKAKIFLGFTHNRFEGVGCQGSGGNILIKPFIGDNAEHCTLIKTTEEAGAGYYRAGFANGIKADMAVLKNAGIENYTFPQAGKKGFYIDLSHTLANPFVAEEHRYIPGGISGWVDARTTCAAGTYRVYYAIKFSSTIQLSSLGEHKLQGYINDNEKQVQVHVAFSSVDEAHAIASLRNDDFDGVRKRSSADWDSILGGIKVKGDPETEKLFYSLLYRTVQSPYLVSEPDGTYRATNGSIQITDNAIYNGWAIWDNYRTQLPLLSLLYPERYKSMITSIANMYKYGKKDYATNHEPSNTVRTEHAIVVLLDAYRKGYKVDFKAIGDSLKAEVDKLDFTHPDKALESSYDTWAFSQIMNIVGNKQLAQQYKLKALEYKNYWNKDFKDLSKRDVDRVSARGMYQGTIWQYRWLVPFDNKGLIDLTGGQDAYLKQLNEFFDNDYYNHANEPDIQAPLMYNFTPEPWKSQALVNKYAADTVVQYYFNDNSRGIDPFVGVIYQNKPDTYVRTMDDDAGAMSAWYVFAATGIFPASSGWPVYYLNVPLFNEVELNAGRKTFIIKVKNFAKGHKYIQSAKLNGKPLTRNWLTHDEITKGGELIITASATPNKEWGTKNQWISSIDMQ
ncbi:glycoside hydrolase family 92 protein [Mucilaginibacter pallidiroseus]|uniref:Glycoside hydrolase family 92 protein n=1 Tax=Mucilaginibacter pallidiroseus TaxID=2599295 RepID=A0A563TZE4_9SPHI|nr:glycoside hydrolase domain-containing protein [Mucilaginibacter pallidiroseus]TWR24736.1 glycoside hydrolase family 92 protein [Mucilaginibacter pallidiroseus]